MGKKRLLGAAVVACYLVLLLSLAVVAQTSRSPQGATSVQHRQPGPYCSISATLDGFLATFTGTIENVQSPFWTLHFGDGSSDMGSGASVSALHTYVTYGSYNAVLDVHYPTGGFAANCGTTVDITHQLTLTLNEAMGVSDRFSFVAPLVIYEPWFIQDRIGSVPPLVIIEKITGIDLIRPGPLPLLVNETAGFIDRPSSSPPPGFNEPAQISDQIYVVKGTQGNGFNFPGGLFGAIGLGAAVLAVGALAVWKMILPRRS